MTVFANAPRLPPPLARPDERAPSHSRARRPLPRAGRMTEAIDERMHRSLAERALGPVQARLAIDTGYGDLIAAARVPDTTGTPAPERAKLEQTPGADF